jgi:hypothetical protein
MTVRKKVLGEAYRRQLLDENVRVLEGIRKWR